MNQLVKNDKNIPTPLLVITAVFIAIILAIASFIFGTQDTGVLPESSLPPLVEPAPTLAPDQNGVVCTMDAKLCSDGSSVGRSGPNCEFAPCPGE